MDEKQTKRRLLVLRDAADVLAALRAEMPVHARTIETTMHRLRAIAGTYEARHAAMKELADAERKPPQRVSVRSRRRQPDAKTRALDAAMREVGASLLPVIVCTRCGCPQGSNRDCPLCYPMDSRNVDEENQG